MRLAHALENEEKIVSNLIVKSLELSHLFSLFL